MKEFFQELSTQLKQGSVWTATVIEGDQAGEKALGREGKLLYCMPEMEDFWKPVMAEFPRGLSGMQIYKTNGRTLFLEPVLTEPELVICGGGHISMELAALADYLEYPYAVLDDREEFCNPTRFARAQACICDSFSKGLEQILRKQRHAWYIIVTRGHKADLECLELILKGSYGYVGMIGSREKVAKTMEVLREKGYDDGVLSQVHAPIGIKIGGQTPKEIAISIVAELIAEKNQNRKAGYLSKEFLPMALSQDAGVVVTILDKQGSAPRGAGSKMLVGKEGILTGTIGGGMIEYEAGNDALAFLQDQKKNRILIRNYQVNSHSAASLGMWCGGAVTVLFERIGME